MSGCQDVRMSDCQDVRMSGCQIVRLSGCQDVRLSGCHDVRKGYHNVKMSIKPVQDVPILAGGQLVDNLKGVKENEKVVREEDE